MEFLKKLLASRSNRTDRFEPATGDTLRRNVHTNNTDCLIMRKKILVDRLRSDPPEHPGDLFYILQKISEYALDLAMLDWRTGIDPRPRLVEIQNSFAMALEVRPDIAPTYGNPGFMAIVHDLMGWDWPFDTDPPGDGEREFDILYMERWIIAGLADPSCWPMKAKAPALKNQFIGKCLDDYWALLTDQIDPAQGIQKCIKNYDRRATHPTLKVLPSYYGGGAYNELFVDYTLAAILKKRRLPSDSVHDWIWG